MRRARCLLASLFIILLGTGCAGHVVYASGPYQGKVTDAETKTPLKGALVLAAWHKYLPVGAHMPRVFVDALEVLTDENGEYTIPSQTRLFVYGTMEEPQLVIYYPGYEPYYPKEYEQRNADVRLAKLKTREERIRFLNLSLYVGDKVPETKVPNLIHLLNEERKALGLDPIGSGGKPQ